MHVGVHESRQQQPTGQLGHRLPGMRGSQGGKGATGDDESVMDQQSAVLVGGQCVGGVAGEGIARGVQDGGAEQCHEDVLMFGYSVREAQSELVQPTGDGRRGGGWPAAGSPSAGDGDVVGGGVFGGGVFGGGGHGALLGISRRGLLLQEQHQGSGDADRDHRGLLADDPGQADR